MNVEEKVKDILLQILDVEETDITPTATFIDDLNATSIDIVEILTALQNTFDIDITEADAEKIKSVQDAVDYLTAALAQKQSAS